jgi:hypothetical protein
MDSGSSGGFAVPASLGAARDVAFGPGVVVSVPAAWSASVASASAPMVALSPPGASSTESHVVAVSPLKTAIAATSTALDEQFRRLCDGHVAAAAPFAALLLAAAVPERPGGARYCYAGTAPGSAVQVRCVIFCCPLGPHAVFVASLGEASTVTFREPDLLSIFTSIRLAAPVASPSAPAQDASLLVGTWADGGGMRRTVTMFLADGRCQIEDAASRQVRTGQWQAVGNSLRLAMSDTPGIITELLWQVRAASVFSPAGLLQTSNPDGTSPIQWTRI